MTRLRSTSLLVSLAAACSTGLTAPALAQSGIIDPPTGRYQMMPVDGGVARLDTATGTVELCQAKGDRMVCGDTSGLAPLPSGSAPAPDLDAEGDADTETTDLQGRLDALDDRVAELEAAQRDTLKLPDTDEAITQMHKLFRGFADIAKELDREFNDDRRGPHDDRRMLPQYKGPTL
ncbi:hypothetical protein [Aurantimonas sp. VKM B-3413]|uniref:hypothetical protein n=1 Tax=Aurantimonas sp. VKM B-3413 TaxID=2779401 RepID=UPI001E553E65|nr:hypothetical protein [Aurantimonas sp. VKM B-3413]MCB8839520.1 hypothetical protein [Aurantimonas sp. VKM B-3413]